MVHMTEHIVLAGTAHHIRSRETGDLFRCLVPIGDDPVLVGNVEAIVETADNGFEIVDLIATHNLNMQFFVLFSKIGDIFSE
jgi:hypothetical protein